MSLILFQIAMLLTAIRRYESDDWFTELVCEDNDYQIAKSLVEVFRQHSFFLFDILGKVKGINYQQLPNRKKRFFENLPEEFHRKEAIKVGQQLGISSASVDRWLKQLTKEYLEQSEYGVYRKMVFDKVDKKVKVVYY